MLTGCRSLLGHSPKIPLAAYEEGKCLGLVATVLALSRYLHPSHQFCPPEGGSLLQATQVALVYIEAKPDRWHEPFGFLELEAFREAWPCP
jgi:hypothetical protein